MYKGLVEGQAIPVNGFTKRLTGPDKKPLIICGEQQNWVFYDKNAPDKFDKSKMIKDAFPDANHADAEGALIYGFRYFRGRKGWSAPPLCGKSTWGSTYQEQDLITFCDSVFSFADEKSPVRDSDKVVEGTDLDVDRFGLQTLVRVMIHEFAHYYGSTLDGNGNVDRRKFR
jgi:hypothetical protein